MPNINVPYNCSPGLGSPPTASWPLCPTGRKAPPLLIRRQSAIRFRMMAWPRAPDAPPLIPIGQKRGALYRPGRGLPLRPFRTTNSSLRRAGISGFGPGFRVGGCIFATADFNGRSRSENRNLSSSIVRLISAATAACSSSVKSGPGISLTYMYLKVVENAQT